MVLRVYVEKKPGFDVEARQLLAELRGILGIESLTGVRLVNRYDVEGISTELFEQCVPHGVQRAAVRRRDARASRRARRRCVRG